MQDSIQNTLRAYYDFWFSCNALYENGPSGRASRSIPCL